MKKRNAKLRIRTGTPTLKRAVTAFKIFHRLADIWGLDANERHCLLGFERASADVGLSEAGVLRLSHLLNIYTHLHELLQEDMAANSWLKSPNDAPLFGGRSALALMCSGRLEDLQAVHEYLAGCCQGYW